MPGLPNTWEDDLQKAQGGYIIGPQLQTRGIVDDPGPGAAQTRWARPLDGMHGCVFLLLLCDVEPATEITHMTI